MNQRLEDFSRVGLRNPGFLADVFGLEPPIAVSGGGMYQCPEGVFAAFGVQGEHGGRGPLIVDIYVQFILDRSIHYWRRIVKSNFALAFRWSRSIGCAVGLADPFRWELKVSLVLDKRLWTKQLVGLPRKSTDSAGGVSPVLKCGRYPKSDPEN